MFVLIAFFSCNCSVIAQGDSDKQLLNSDSELQQAQLKTIDWYMKKLANTNNSLQKNEIYTNMAYIYMDLSDTAKAINCYGSVVKLYLNSNDKYIEDPDVINAYAYLSEMNPDDKIIAEISKKKNSFEIRDLFFMFKKYYRSNRVLLSDYCKLIINTKGFRPDNEIYKDCLNLIKTYPNSILTPVLLFRLANIYDTKVVSAEDRAEYLKEIIDKYPKSESLKTDYSIKSGDLIAPRAQLLLAWIYLNNPDNNKEHRIVAIKEFQKIIDNFPDYKYECSIICSAYIGQAYIYYDFITSNNVEKSDYKNKLENICYILIKKYPNQCAEIHGNNVYTHPESYMYLGKLENDKIKAGLLFEKIIFDFSEYQVCREGTDACGSYAGAAISYIMQSGFNNDYIFALLDRIIKSHLNNDIRVLAMLKKADRLYSLNRVNESIKVYEQVTNFITNSKYEEEDEYVNEQKETAKRTIIEIENKNKINK